MDGFAVPSPRLLLHTLRTFSQSRLIGSNPLQAAIGHPRRKWVPFPRQAHPVAGLCLLLLLLKFSQPVLPCPSQSMDPLHRVLAVLLGDAGGVGEAAGAVDRSERSPIALLRPV